MKKSILPMNLQLFGGDGGNSGAQGNNQDSNSNNQAGGGQQAQPVVDYQKIQQMLDGTLAAKEKTALSAYFKQQGLSQDEAEKAMQAFKEAKAKNQPDVSKLQMDLDKANILFRKSQIENAAILMSTGLGIEAKTIPYLIKMADLSKAIADDGKINEEEIKNAINKVLEDIPGLKTTAENKSGFIQVGASGQGNQSNVDEQLKKAFGL